jgi:hypothetical protein
VIGEAPDDFQFIPESQNDFSTAFYPRAVCILSVNRHQPLLQRFGHRFGFGANLQLLINMPDVRADGILADE